MVKYNIATVAVIGPKPYFLGGHDNDCNERNLLRNKFTDILKNLLDKENKIIGLTGLNLGAEQDFAAACWDLDIPYDVYLTHAKQENYWKNLSKDITEKYKFFLSKSRKIIQIENGKFTPIKHFNKINTYINNAKYIIYKKSELNQYEKILRSYQGILINV